MGCLRKLFVLRSLGRRKCSEINSETYIFPPIFVFCLNHRSFFSFLYFSSSPKDIFPSFFSQMEFGAAALMFGAAKGAKKSGLKGLPSPKSAAKPKAAARNGRSVSPKRSPAKAGARKASPSKAAGQACACSCKC